LLHLVVETLVGLVVDGSSESSGGARGIAFIDLQAVDISRETPTMQLAMVCFIVSLFRS